MARRLMLSGWAGRIGRVRPLLVAAAIVVGASGACAAPADEEGPPIGPLQDMKVAGPLSAGEKKLIDDYVKGWCVVMAKTGKLDTITKAGKALDDGYKAQEPVQNSAYYTVPYASAVDANADMVLKQANPVKQIQIAMAAARMSQYTIQPLLERMSVHANAAVRYWSARGYGAAAKRIADQDPASAARMFATLQRLGLKESSGALLEAVLAALAPSDARPAHIDASRQAIDAVWQARCADIQAGKVDAIDAYRATIGLLAPAGDADKKAILQLLADALEAASLALLKKEHQDDPSTAGALTQLLIALETKLVEISATTDTPIQTGVNKTSDPPALRVIQARLAVNTYWKPILAKAGVTTRVKPLPTTLPAAAAAPK